jgi:glycosyltransferase involved in cell wall biosynthesis
VKIVLAAASFSPEISGVQRHALNVARCLAGHPDISRVHLVVAPWQRELVQTVGFDSSKTISVHVAEMDQTVVSRNLWYYRQLPALVRDLQPNLVHLSYPVPINARAVHCPIVLSLHDLYPYEIPANFGYPKVLFNRLILQQCMRGADAIACVSDATVSRLRQYAPEMTWRKATRIYNCVEQKTDCAAIASVPGLQGEPFLLAVAQHRANKNIPLLIRVFHRLLRERSVDSGMKLIIVGINGPETDRIHQVISDFDLTHKVVFLKGLPEAELQWCYKRCEALVAPSVTEGFGLPVAEALLAGCRIVCSDIPAFREISEEHCRFVPLGNRAEEALAHAIQTALQGPRKVPVILPQFSCKTLAAQYVVLYRGLLQSAPRAHEDLCGCSVPASESRSS